MNLINKLFNKYFKYHLFRSGLIVLCHPSSVMDMSFANQALAAEYMSKENKNLDKKVYPVHEVIDENYCLAINT